MPTSQIKLVSGDADVAPMAQGDLPGVVGSTLRHATLRHDCMAVEFDRRACAVFAAPIGNAVNGWADYRAQAHQERVRSGLNDTERQTLRDLRSRFHQVGEGRN